MVLSEVNHSIRSMLYNVTNVTPHQRLFQYQHRFPSEHSLPTWLTSPGPVLLHCHVQNSNYDPLVDEPDLIEANPQYPQIQLADR